MQRQVADIHAVEADGAADQLRRDATARDLAILARFLIAQFPDSSAAYSSLASTYGDQRKWDDAFRSLRERHLATARELDAVKAHALELLLRGQLMLALYRCGRQAEALGEEMDKLAGKVDHLAEAEGLFAQLVTAADHEQVAHAAVLQVVGEVLDLARTLTAEGLGLAVAAATLSTTWSRATLKALNSSAPTLMPRP